MTHRDKKSRPGILLESTYAIGLGINDDRGDKQKEKDSERNVSGARLFFNVQLQEVRTETIGSASRAVIDEARKKPFTP